MVKNVCIKLDEELVRKVTEGGKFNINKSVTLALQKYLDYKRDCISELSTFFSCKDFYYLCELLSDVSFDRFLYKENMLEYIYADRDLFLRRGVDVTFVIDNLSRLNKIIYRTLLDCIEYYRMMPCDDRIKLDERKESFSLFYDLTPCLFN